MGYPDVHLLFWQTGTGERVAGQIESEKVNVTVTSTLTLQNLEHCGRFWGYTCSFINRGAILFTRDVFVPCPPGLLFIQQYY